VPAWLTLPLLVDLILLGMLCEVGWLFWRHWRLDMRGVPPFLLQVMSGILLLLAMKLALQTTDVRVIASVLGLSGIIHFFDLRSDSGRPPGPA
jgi:hypothetical protein